jgi:nitroimidazol reductase NimA-like FMN-containing flavoprotein (pyridoxamine 5'-phosphate oxidase superfamily)
MKEDIKAYLDEAKMMQLATSRDNKPWICNVWSAVDKDLNIYWISATTRRHSGEIKDNEYVAASFCLVRDPSETSRGAIQLEGVAHEVTNPLEIAKALKLYVACGIFSLEQVKKFMADLKYPHRFYRIEPKRIVLFDGSAKEYIPE